MKTSITSVYTYIPGLLILISLSSCGEIAEAKILEEPADNMPNSNAAERPEKKLTEEFKAYWYAGEAEITSYKLEQARYGELRDGHAVLVYVSEPFLASEQVKANKNSPKNISVLKLNSTKKYLTGVYPYSIMTSTFYPVHDNQHAIKVSTSVQEWCGHVYSQLNNREDFEIESHSYFEGEADSHVNLPKTWLENEIWSKVRINPEELPQGNLQMIPSFEYIRTAHKEIKSYSVKATMSSANGMSTYTLDYEDLDRTLQINFSTAFPFSIESWTETFKSGFGPGAKLLTSRATKMKVLKTPYWQQNSTEDEKLRKELGI
ncbi:MAG: septum formation inhibitor Maf [Flavobacteriaceae bacterium]